MRHSRMTVRQSAPKQFCTFPHCTTERANYPAGPSGADAGVAPDTGRGRADTGSRACDAEIADFALARLLLMKLEQPAVVSAGDRGAFGDLERNKEYT